MADRRWSVARWRVRACLVSLLLAGCDGADPTPEASPAVRGTDQAGAMRFTDISSETGVRMILTCGRQPPQQILEVKGCGLALIDFDRDGDSDLFAPNGATLDDPESGPGCRLFENRGRFRFVDVTAKAGLTHRRWSFGVAVGDYDADGFDDLYVACFGPNVLLRNDGDGTFTDVSEQAGVADRRWGTGCAFGDVDGDGDLDLYVANYLEFDVARPPPRTVYLGATVLGGPHGLPPAPDRLYENLGDGTFRDGSRDSRCGEVAPAYGLNVVIVDLTGDGLQDIYVGNDSMGNFLFENRGEGRFEERGVESGISFDSDGSAQATMGIAIADIDGNHLPDLFTTNFSSDMNTLHLNLGGARLRDRAHFRDRTQQYGLGRISWRYLGWACGFHDFDLDGDEDLLVVNGHVYPQAQTETLDSDYEQTPLLFERKGSRFVQVRAGTAGPWLAEAHRDRTAVFGDLDADGDIDAVIGELGGPLRFLRNDTRRAADSAWLIVELKDSRPDGGNHRGLGSRVELEAGGTRQTRWVYGGGPFQSTSAQVAHFGLRPAPAAVNLGITWPDGTQQRLERVTLNQRLVVERAAR